MHLTNEQKLQILRSHLSGNALLLTETLPITKENYTVACNLLEDRHYNKRSLSNYFYSKIQNFQLSGYVKSDISNFKARYVSAINAIKSLNIDLENFLILQLGL